MTDRPAPRDAFVPGDLSKAEIERRYQLALRDIRRGGTGEVARATSEPPQPTLRSGEVLTALAQEHTTVPELARRLGQRLDRVWGHICFLRKCNKVEVKAWVTSPRGRRLAVYGVRT